MKRRIRWALGVVLILSVTLCMMCGNAFADDVTIVDSGTCGNNLTWILNDQGTLTISGSGAMTKYDPYSSTRIYPPWYSNRTSIQSVEIEQGVTSVGDYAFYQCSSLTDVTFSDSVTAINKYAFGGCSSLTELTLPANLVSVGKYFISDTSIEKITIPKTVTTCPYSGTLDGSIVNEVVFEEGMERIPSICYNDSLGSSLSHQIETVTIPESATYIELRAFCNCDNLKSITIPKDVTCISSGAFWNCKSLEHVQFDQNDATGFQLTIEDSAFRDCVKLNEISLPDYVTTIWNEAFRGCYSLNELILPSKLKTIGYNIIAGTKIKSIIIPKGVQDRASGDLYGPLTGSGVTKVSFENGIKKIPNSVCYKSDNLTTVGIPNSVTEIGWNAFAYCKKIKDINIPTSVTIIGQSAFSGCESLDVIDLPQSVKVIGSYSYNECDCLVSISIPENVTQINTSAFLGCSNLNQIYFSGDAPSFGDNAFQNVTATAYYPSDKSSWTDSVKQDYGGTLTWVPWDPRDELFNPVDPTCVNNEIYAFRSMLNNENNMYYTFDYNDNWFFSDDTSDKYSLLKTSIRVAMAAYGTKDGENGAGPENIKDMMYKMGFKYTDESITYERPTYDSIGSAIGLKNIRQDDGASKSIILVAIRGGGYGAEWGGDFRLGTASDQNHNSLGIYHRAKYHEGFEIAAEKVLSRLNDFINQNGMYISDDAQIWITGYSRGAATANLTAAWLIDGKASEMGLSPDNVSAFCFECPKNVIDPNARNIKRYHNIVNIVNPIDFVTKVAFNGWDFTRYGITYYIPSRESTYGYTERYKYPMIGKYQELCRYCNPVRNISNNVVLTDNEIVENISQASFLDEYFDNFSNNISREKYFCDHEEHVIQIAGNLLGGGPTPDWASAVPAILKTTGVTAVLHPVSTGRLIGLFLKKNTGPGPAAHYPELCLSWIDSLQSFSSFDTVENSSYRLLKVNCPVDVSVYDSTGKLVGHVVDHEVKEIEDGVGAEIDENGQILFVLPSDEEFSVDIKATDDGKVNCTMQEYNFDSNKTSVLMNYKNIEVHNGDTLTGSINEAEKIGDSYYVMKNETELIVPDEVLTGGDVVEFIVEVTNDGDGKIQGGGSFVSGEFSKVTATANLGSAFVGWYKDDVCVSEEEEYRFPVEGNTELLARFERIPSKLIAASLTLDGQIGINYYLQLTDNLIDTGAKVRFTQNDVTTDVPITSEHVTTLNGETMYKFTYDVAAKEMNDTILLQIVDDEGNVLPLVNSKDVDVSEGYQYSVAKYCDLVKTYGNDKIKNLTKVMMNYGGYTQDYFGYGTGEGKNDDLRADMDAVTMDTMMPFKAVQSESKVSGISYYATSLLLESETTIRHYFTLEDGAEIEDYTFTCGDNTLTPVAKNGQYYVEVTNIAAKDLDTAYTVTLAKGDDTYSITYYALSYGYSVLKNSNKESLLDMVKALYLYNQAANMYFGDN